MIYWIITAIVLLIALLLWACSKLNDRSTELNDLKTEHSKYISLHDKTVEEKDTAISTHVSEKFELNRTLQHTWEVVKQHPKYEKFRWKGAELSLVVTGVIMELWRDINLKNKKLNAQKSVINRRDKRIISLLNKKSKKWVK